ncbi:aldehyde dehydrogenase family protein [Streptomyces sp. NPDC047028]|uniref:aldehyde dehydrogenase family protein n=1 Tax=Streptomyces sp. NPDC047028 TaxID=3155793 RepID=UPI0033D9C601
MPPPAPRADHLCHLTAGGGTPLPLTSAFTGENLGVAPTCTAADILATVHRARQHCRLWASTPGPARRKALGRLLALVRADRQALLPLAQHSCALSHHDAAADFAAAARPHAATRANGWQLFRRQPLADADAAVLSTRTDDARPFTSLLETVLPALCSGSCVITQVTRRTAVVAARLAALAFYAGIPETAWQLVLGADHQIHALLTEHTDTHQPGCCPLRPGGARPTAPALMAIRHDARLPAALRAALQTCFAGAGRVCTSTPVVAVHTGHYQRFVEEFAHAAARLPVLPPLQEHSTLSALADASQAAGLRAYLRAAPAAGTNILYDAGPRPALAPALHGPVVLTHPHTWTLDPAAIPPGPLAVLVPFRSWSQVLDLARSSGRHVSIHTTTAASQLLPQFASLAADDVAINAPLHRRPRPTAARTPHWTPSLP